MTRVSASELRKDAADILNRVAYGNDRVILHRRDKDVAVIIPLKDYEVLRRLEDEEDLKIIRKSKKDEGDLIEWETLKKECNL
jgi:antitoxin Phd